MAKESKKKDAPANAAESVAIEFMEVRRGIVEFCVLGTSGYIAHAISEKTQYELLIPKPKPPKGKGGSTPKGLKHNPLEEFGSAPYVTRDDDAPTRIVVPSVMFKAALRSAATDMPESSKAEIGRLTWVMDEITHIYGVPRLFMSNVRNKSQMGPGAPDIRTRAILPQWAARVRIGYTIPHLKERVVGQLLAAAGIWNGIGDWRQQKGSGSYGCFELVSADDPRFLAVVKNGGREAQDEALANPVPHDEMSARLLAYWTDEATRRGFNVDGGSEAA